MPARHLKIESALLALAFLDLFGFGMLIPDIQLRAEAMGAPGWLIGTILSSMFVVQFFASSRWGRLSDRIGRKPVVVVCTLISAASMVVYAFAQNPAHIMVSRLMGGLGAANIAVAQAYVADLASSGAKVAAMGRIGAAVSAGLILGPAVGGFLAKAGGNLLLGLVAAGASCAGALAAWFLLPQVPTTEQESRAKGSFDLLRTIPGLARVFLVVSVSWFALATLEGTFGRLIKSTLGLGSAEFGVVFAYESLLGLIVQSTLVGPLTKRVREDWALRASYALMGFGLVLFPFAPTFATILVASTLYGVGTSVANPTANALCSALTPEDRQGELFGLLQSARSFGFLLGPVIGGVLFDAWRAAPYVAAMAVCLLAAVAVPKRSTASALG